MWKVFLVISAVVLAGSAYLAWDNKSTLEDSIAAVETEKATLDKRQKAVVVVKEELAKLEQSTQKYLDEAESLATAKIDLDAKTVEAESNLKMLQSKTTLVKTELEKARKTLEHVDEVRKIQKEMVQIQTQIEAAELDVVQKEGAAAAAKVDADRLSKVAAELAALRADQAAGLIRGDFQSNVKKAYNKWGFVVVNGGNDQGVVDRAQLDVYRRGQPICKLLVTSVEPSESVAEIIPGSLAAGQTVQIGDTVVKTIRGGNTPARPVAPKTIPAGAPKTAAPAGGSMTSPAAAPASKPAGEPDPFGGGMGKPAAPAAKPAEPDPFGSSKPAAPAAKPAEPDPFGGSKPAAPEKKPAEPDPFK